MPEIHIALGRFRVLFYISLDSDYDVLLHRQFHGLCVTERIVRLQKSWPIIETILQDS